MAVDDYLVVLTTLGTVADARRFVRRLLEDRLVACGTIVPGATSIYRWHEQVTEEGEVVVLLKTPRSRWEALQTAVTTHHPYELPELLALPVTSGLESYLSWVSGETIAGDAAT